MPTTFEKFCSLFEGRTDAYGTDEGGCVRSPLEGYDYWGAHWHGSRPLGVYPLVHADDGWVVRWGAVDLDVKREGKSRYDYETEADAEQAAWNLVLVLREFGVVSWCEVTKSHGRHVWVFAEDWVSASTMRRALLVACQVAGVPPTEVNPKSERFDDPRMLGNYVRLPYVGDSLTDRYIVSVERTPFRKDEFIGKAWNTRTPALTIAKIAGMYVPPVMSRVVLSGGHEEYDGELNDDVTPYIRTVLERGPTDEGRDRSGWLWWLAGRCREEELSPECTLAVLTSADETWTHKYDARKDPYKYYAEIVEKVYT